MLVIGTASSETGLRWSGRRHDDDGPGVSRGDTVDGLFEAVFHALHDGEQVAIGFRAPLAVAGAAGDDPALAQLTRAEGASASVRDVAALLSELGRWRPWTVVSTSLPRWRATTSVLVWETELSGAATEAEIDDAVESFYALVGGRADHGAEVAVDGLVNLAVVAAGRGELTVDGDQIGEPVVLVPHVVVAPPG